MRWDQKYHAYAWALINNQFHYLDPQMVPWNEGEISCLWGRVNRQWYQLLIQIKISSAPLSQDSTWPLAQDYFNPDADHLLQHTVERPMKCMLSQYIWDKVWTSRRPTQTMKSKRRVIWCAFTRDLPPTFFYGPWRWPPPSESRMHNHLVLWVKFHDHSHLDSPNYHQEL